MEGDVTTISEKVSKQEERLYALERGDGHAPVRVGKERQREGHLNSTPRASCNRGASCDCEVRMRID